MAEPQITTIIPTFRRPKMLPRAIESVLAQTYRESEVLVLDNASGDETREVVSEIAQRDPRVKYHCHDENLGSFANFQYGLHQVRTEFFSILSDDDLVLPHFFETAMRGFEAHPDAMFSGGITPGVFPSKRLRIPHTLLRWAPGRHDPPQGAFDMLRYDFPVWTGLVFRRRVLDEVGYLSSEAGPIADVEFELRIALRFPFVLEPRPCALIAYHADSATTREGKALEDFCGLWLAMGDILVGGSLEPAVAQRLRSLFTRKVLGKATSGALEHMRRRRFGEAAEAIRIVDDRLGRRRLARLLRMLACAVRWVPLASRLLGWGLKLARLSRRGWRRHSSRVAEEARAYVNALDPQPG